MSVPKTPSTVSCPFCSATNPVDRRFCGGCGEELTDECPKCRFKINVSEGFCGGCGYHVHEHYQQQIKEIETRLGDIESLVVENKFDEAISILSLLSRYTHPRVRQASEKVSRLYTLVRDKRDKKVSEVLAHCYSAKNYLATGLISSAVAELERVPRHMLPPKAKSMLAELQFKQKQIDRLKSEIKKQIAAKQFAEILPKIANLLTLAPDETEYLAVGEKIAARQLQEAKKLAASSQYAQSMKILADIIPPFQSEASQQLLPVVRDRMANQYAVANQCLADQQLLELSQRLKKLDPRHPQWEMWDSEIRKRSQSRSTEPRLDLRLRSKEQPSVIPGVRAWQFAQPTTVRFAEADDAALAAQHLDTIGLAIQAFLETPVPHNFADQKSNWLAVFGSRKSKAAWGITWEGHHIRAALVQASPDSAGHPIVQKLLSFQLPESTEESNRTRIQNLLSKLLPHLKQVPADLVMGLSPRKVLPRFFSVPMVDQKKTLAAVEMELQHQSPFPKDQVESRYKMFDIPNASGARAVMGTIVRKSDLTDLLGVCESLAIKPAILQSTPQALFNLLSREWFEHPSSLTDQNRGLIQLHVQDEMTVYLAAHRNRFWWRYFPLGRNELITMVARQLKLTTQQAVKVIAHPALAPRFDLFLDTLRDYYERLLIEVLRSHNQAEQFMKGLDTSNLICSGHSLPSLLDALQNGSDRLVPWTQELSTESDATDEDALLLD